MAGRDTASTRPSDETIQRVREFNTLRDRSLAAQSPGTTIDAIERRMTYLHMALLARDSLASDGHLNRWVAARASLTADQQAFREIIRDHAPTPSGHCQRCHLPAPVTFVFYDWPCPTVSAVETALLALTTIRA